MLLQLINVEKSYGNRTLFTVPSLSVYHGQRIGIVGRNGDGKTTLLSLIAGELQPDSGTVVVNGTIAYLRQQPDNSAPCSGGEAVRERWLAAAYAGADILLADEPTANLDEDGQTMVEEGLRHYDGAVLLISHDRTLLNAISDTIWELERGEFRVYKGNYTQYKEQKRLEVDFAHDEYERYIDERDRLRSAITKRAGQAGKVKKAPKRMGNSEARLHRRSATEIAEKLHKSTKALESRLEQLEVKQRPFVYDPIIMDFTLTKPPISKTALRVENLTVGYGELVVLDGLSLTIANGEHVAIVGHNGAGKTTLFNAILNGHDAVKLAPGTVIGYISQTLDTLDERRTLLENALYDSVQSRTITQTVLARMQLRERDYHKQIAQLSGGERLKLCLVKLLCGPSNLLILDEPTNYLDIHALEALESLLLTYPGTILFTSHDRHFTTHCAHRQILLPEGVSVEV